MSAIQPNKDFDSQRQEHVPYSDKKPINLMASYQRLMKPDPNVRHRAAAIKDPTAYQKWFNKQ